MYMEEHTHGGTYSWTYQVGWDIYTVGHTHGELYTRRDIYVRA